MIVSKVIGKWMFINRPDEEGRYRVTFEVNEEQDKIIQKALNEVLKTKGIAPGPDSVDWYATRKESDEGVISYGAKCSKSITRKDGTLVERILPVYNYTAVRYTEDGVPTPANGALINIEIEPYFVEYKKKKGVMLNLRSVQLLKYEDYTSPNPYSDESDEYSDTPQDTSESTSGPNTYTSTDSKSASDDIFE